jgi:hypothetical protein
VVDFGITQIVAIDAPRGAKHRPGWIPVWHRLQNRSLEQVSVPSHPNKTDARVRVVGLVDHNDIIASFSEVKLHMTRVVSSQVNEKVRLVLLRYTPRGLQLP